MGFELVIFDNDGVLVDSEPISCRIVSEMLCDWGYATSPERCLRDFQGGTFARLHGIIHERTGRHLPGDFYPRYQETLFERFPRELEPIAGVREALERIPLAKCVASSASMAKIVTALELVQLREPFGEHLFSAQQVGRGKPAPDLFLHAAEAMGVDPSRTCVIEDSRLGVQAANAAGMTCFAYAATTPWESLEPERGRRFTSMEELPGLLEVGSLSTRTSRDIATRLPRSRGRRRSRG